MGYLVPGDQAQEPERLSQNTTKKKYYKKFDKMSDGEMLEVIQVTDDGELFVIYIIDDEEICRVKVYV